MYWVQITFLGPDRARRSDGRYIEALYELALKEPLNAAQELGFAQEHLRYMKDIIHGTQVEDSGVPSAAEHRRESMPGAPAAKL